MEETMAMIYHVTAIDILKILGYTEPTGKKELEIFEKENNLKLPRLLFEFLSLAKDNPLLGTADIWNFPYFSYEDIKERIEEDKEYWEENPESCAEDEYFAFSQIPVEQWSNYVANYLQIGSDYAAGVVNFGIRVEDLTQENPPVYILNEADTLKDWNMFYHTLSDYLMSVLCDVLVCVQYHTAKRVLQKKGWNFFEYKNLEDVQTQLSQRNIDLSAMKKYPSLYGEDDFYRCCYYEEEKTCFVITNDVALLMLQ